MKLRRLMLKDAPLMLEWMRDESVVKGNLQDSFLQKTLADCEEFINEAQEQSENLHLAIADGRDAYMGTVSLKHIHDHSAEFAIAMRRVAMGKGFSRYGMREMLRIGLEELGLKSIYWYVKPENTRALRFYDKNGYRRTTVSDVIRHGGVRFPTRKDTSGICRRGLCRSNCLLVGFNRIRTYFFEPMTAISGRQIIFTAD